MTTVFKTDNVEIIRNGPYPAITTEGEHINVFEFLKINLFGDGNGYTSRLPGPVWYLGNDGRRIERSGLDKVLRMRFVRFR